MKNITKELSYILDRYFTKVIIPKNIPMFLDKLEKFETLGEALEDIRAKEIGHKDLYMIDALQDWHFITSVDFLDNLRDDLRSLEQFLKNI